MRSLSLVMSECFLRERGQGHVSNFYIVDLENFATASRRYTGDIHNSTNPNPKNQPNSEIHQGVEKLSVMLRCYANDRDQLEDRRRYDRDRHAEEKYHRRPDRRHYRPDHRGLSADQTRWLKRMPHDWRY